MIVKTLKLLFLSGLLAVYSILLSLTICPINYPLRGDREVFRYMGMLIRQGGIPYRDAFDQKTPLLWLFAAWSHPWGPWGLWSVEVFFLVVSAIFIFFFAKRQRWFFPLIYPLLYISLYCAYTINMGFGYTRGISTSLCTFVICLMDLGFEWIWLLAGLLSVMIFLTQQNEVFAIVPFLWLAAPRNNAPKLLRAGIGFILGCAVGWAPLVIWLVRGGGWDGFIEMAILFNTKYYIYAHPWIYRIPSALKGLWLYGFDRPLLVLAGLSLWLHLKGQRMQKTLLTAWIALAVHEFFSVALSAHRYPYYYLGTIPYVILIMGYTLQEVRQLKLFSEHRFALALLMVGLWYLLPFDPTISKLTDAYLAVQAVHRGDKTVYEQWEMSEPDLMKALAQVKNQRGQLSTVFNSQRIFLNTDLNIIQPSRCVLCWWSSQFPTWDKDRSHFKSILSGLERYRTKYVLDSNGGYFLYPDMETAWHQYRAAHYRPLLLTKEGSTLYIRRMDPGD